MKLRILISTVLVTALALPVIATATRFPDVPADHQYVDAIRWASDSEEFNGNPIFRGFPDGDFRPDKPLSEIQFIKVVDRLFDSADEWTRAETAALLYYGFQGLRSNPLITTTTTTTTQPTTTTTTTQPVVIEGEQPGGNGPGEVEETTTTTTTTTQPTTTTTTEPLFPIGERTNTLVMKYERAGQLFQIAANNPHNKDNANSAKQAADEAMEYAIQLQEEYRQHGDTNDPNRHHHQRSLEHYHQRAVRQQSEANLIVEWQTVEQPANTPDKKVSFIKLDYPGFSRIPNKFRVSLEHLDSVQRETQGYSDDIKRELYRYIFYHALPMVEELDTLAKEQPTSDDRYEVGRISSQANSIFTGAFNWLMADAGFSSRPYGTYTRYWWRSYTTTTNQSFPIEERLTKLEEKIEDTSFRFRKATHFGGHYRSPAYLHAKTRQYGTFVKQTADDAVQYATQLQKEYNNHPEATNIYKNRLRNTYNLAVRWQTTAGILVEWQTTEPTATEQIRQTSSTYWNNDKYSLLFTEELRELLNNVRGLYSSDRYRLSDDDRRVLHKYMYYHTLLAIDKLDTLKQRLTSRTDRDTITSYQNTIRGQEISSSISWLMNDAGFGHIYKNNRYQFQWQTS